jgi:hypothetical protein
LTERYIFLVDVGVLVKLREALVEPGRQPGVGLAEGVVGVLVIDGGVGMVVGGVETHQDVAGVGRVQEEAAEVSAALAQVLLRFKRVHGVAVFDGEHGDGRV